MRCLLAVALALCVAGPARAEMVQGLSAPSPALGRDLVYALYRPPGVAPGVRLPVIQLLHGLGDKESDWVSEAHLDQVLDGLILSGKLRPVLVVMPRGERSWYVDSPWPGGAGAFARAISEELVNAVDRSEATLACRDARASAGISMGGYGAVLHATMRPDRYGAAATLSGAFFAPAALDPVERSIRNFRMMGSIFGSPLNPVLFNPWSLFERVPAIAALPLKPALWFAVGSTDFAGLKQRNYELAAELTARGLPVSVIENEGGHQWPTWIAQMPAMFSWLDSQLARSCPGDEQSP